MGTKAKVWLASNDDDQWLFKRVRGDADRAEDWPEKAAAELAQVLGLPSARVEFADHHGERGIISCSVAGDRDVVHGNEVLFGRDPTYEKHKRRPEQGYTLTAVREALIDIAPPWGWPEPTWTAYDVFTGYLMFDALIANQDRHHENWAILVDKETGERNLSPSFDHASSLGFMLTDADRQERLSTKDQGRSVQHWAERGRSHHFQERPSLLNLARNALDTCAPEVVTWWIERIRSLGPNEWERILNRVPRTRMSVVTRTFASELLTINRRRLLDECSDLGTRRPRTA